MATRSQYFNNKRRHDQREFGKVKPTAAPTGTDTAWIPPFVQRLQDLPMDVCITLDGEEVEHLLPRMSTEERSIKLRKVSSMGILRMHKMSSTDVETKVKKFGYFYWTRTEMTAL